MDKLIYIAGHRGMVGSAIMRRLQSSGTANLLTRTHAELDLTNAQAVDAFFAEYRPAQVYLAAAKLVAFWRMTPIRLNSFIRT